MSYLNVLMSNDVPAEGNAKNIFKKHEEEDRIIVPSAVPKSDENTDEQSTDSSKNYKKKKFKKVFKNKNSLRKGDSGSKKSSKKPKDPNYNDAFQKAQLSFLKECRPDSNGNAIISQSLEYINNWQGYYVKVDLSEDNILITHEDKEYNFSKKRFISNKYFQMMIRDDYNSAYGNAYLRFFPTKGEENTYTIHVKSGRR